MIKGDWTCSTSDSWWEVEEKRLPERTTISDFDNPCLPKFSTSWEIVISGPGKLLTASAAIETRPSRRPAGTLQSGPWLIFTLSRAANARISAQETTPGQTFSTAALTVSIAWNPSRRSLGGAFFSVPGPSKSTDPSHPCIWIQANNRVSWAKNG